MILIADGGSTKVDWVAIDCNKKVLFKTQTQGLNPATLSNDVLYKRLIDNTTITTQKNLVTNIYFYGAGCGTQETKDTLKKVFQKVFTQSKTHIHEDILAAVYATSGGKEAIVCILGTGSNSCYYDGKKATSNVVSLGYILMDEASANYYGKQLIRDYYYNIMPIDISKHFKKTYDLNPDSIKNHLYKFNSPNTYLGEFAQFMFEYKDNSYMHNMIKEGFKEFFKYRILPYKKDSNIPIYFIGSIAFFFREILENVADNYGYSITDVIRRPIDNLTAYHQKLL